MLDKSLMISNFQSRYYLGLKSTSMDHHSFKAVALLTSKYAADVLRLYKQTWWAADRDLSSTVSVMEGSDLNVGVFDPASNLIGYARVITDGVEKAMIFDVIVDEAYQGKKMGRLIMGSILSSEVCADVNHIELYCKEEMKPFYKKMGFVDITTEVRLLRLSK